MAAGGRGWTILVAAGLALALLASGVSCSRREGVDDGTQQGGGAATTEPDGSAGAVGAETADAGDAGNAEDVGADAALTVKVKTALAADPRVSALMIDVDAQNGIVTLKGDVESAEARSAAEEVTRGTEGITDVVNMLTTGTAGGEGGSPAGQGTRP